MSNFFRSFFYPIFFLLFVFSFFLIEGEYRFYLFGLWTILFLVFGFQRLKTTDDTVSKTVFFALVLSVLFIISNFFARQVPISIEKTLFYLVSLSTFIFFSVVPKDKFETKLFTYYLSIVTLVINLLVLFLTFYQPQQGIFPGMNLFVRNYGHNHYAAFLLLVIPIFWWQLLFMDKQNRDNKLLTIILLISSYLLIIFSLARLALLISLLQLFAVFFVNKKVFASFRIDALAKVLAKTFIFAFLSIGTIFLFLSIPLNKNGTSLCPLIFSNKEICKPLLENDRFIYWRKAWLIFKDNPIFGVGLKNFNFAGRQFPIKNQQIISYAHNIFLHNLAEGGLIVGGFFIFFIFYIFYRSFIVLKKNDKSIYKFLWLAALSSLLNAMFDFDWNFFIIFTLTLIFLAIILRDDQHSKTIRLNFFRGYFAFLVIITTFFALYNLAAEIVYKINKPELITRYLSYSDNKVRLLASEKKLTITDSELLYPIYKNDPEFLFRFIPLEQSDVQKQIELQMRYADLYPSAFINSIDFDEFSYEAALPLANKFTEVLTKHNFLNNGNFLDYWDQRDIAQQFFNFANQAYEANNPELAANYYKKAILLNELVMMGDTRSSFLDGDDLSEAAIFLKYFSDFNPESMNQYFYDYMSVYRRALIFLFQNDNLDDFYMLSEAMFKQQPNFSWFMWRDLIAESKTKEERQRLLLVYDHFKDMSTWYDFMPTIIQFKLNALTS